MVVVLHDLAHVRRIVESIHFFHTFGKKTGRFLWQVKQEFIEGLLHDFKVVAARRYDTAIDMQQTPAA